MQRNLPKQPRQISESRLPIVYDGDVISAPTVQSAITDGSCQITGMIVAYEEAEQLASTIRIGSLSLELQELQF